MAARRSARFLSEILRTSLAEPRRSRGFALLLVLWVLVLIAFLVAQVTEAGRTELRIAGNLYANAAAEAALEGAVNEAVFHLSDPQPGRRWAFDRRPYELTIGHSRIVLRIENEAGRINPNFASPAVLEGLLRATGSTAETAKPLATAIAEWVGTPVAGRSAEKAAADYRAAGRDYAPPRQPMETLDELDRVLGMTPPVLAAIRPHLTVYGPQIADPAAADSVVKAALKVIGRGGISETDTTPRGRSGRIVTARIHATAHGPDNAEVSRTAVVRLNREKPYASVMLAWGPSID
jgi:general secretion pathway protein K